VSWSATQYVKFEDERTRPVRDLVAAIPAGDVARAVDVGCGPGNSTECLIARFPDAAVSGLDSSPDMIAAARERLPEVRFEVDDVSQWPDPGPFDVILSNAVLQWVPNHDTLLPFLLAKLSPGGSLAVQIPDNHQEPAQRLMREVAAQGPWAEQLSPILKTRRPPRGLDWYFARLDEHAAKVDIWRTTYHHRLAGGVDDLIEWFRGTGLRRYLDPIDEALRPGYLARYREALDDAYPPLADGSVLLPFPRLFFVATR
jgi:trans-aconitate 2-methyltransferase